MVNEWDERGWWNLIKFNLQIHLGLIQCEIFFNSKSLKQWLSPPERTTLKASLLVETRRFSNPDVSRHRSVFISKHQNIQENYFSTLASKSRNQKYARRTTSLESLLLKDPNTSAICPSVERNFEGEDVRLWWVDTVRANLSSWGESCPSATCHLD